ncbi:Putative transmembrane protein (Alph_Pro_TM) [Desulfosporosinus orientis DSM 765]|uniref:Putative transmembrane protein (Alph_Pro_TM) n=1 Tax=Desulfosporosinus orientis (strain ATCC 19365 / DSM 765 / NCIMB 8382 / VKM B-1628 / Singapore I) TaxID=768706 RepID=G7W9D5_DESOD|nr:TIGR02186 family protein [Desulfosporosinus orientis]AET69272.1 Putative transmembrane protein (Alph_Pro_TM) [Desulfosporosinus orientis DSM 765]
MIKLKMRSSLIATFVIIFIFMVTNQAWASELTLKTNISEINIGMTFNGAELKITGDAPENDDIYLKLSSSPETVVSLDKKSKVGPFWLNSEHYDVKNMPRFYQVWSSAPLANLTPALSKQIGIDSDFNAVKDDASVVSRKDGQETVVSGATATEFINGLVDIYRKSSAYSINNGQLNIDQGNYSVAITLPATMPKSDITIQAYAVRNGILLGSTKQEVKVNTVGLIDWFCTTAALNGPMYGAIAAIVALICGLGLGQIFHFVSTLGTRKKHHLNGM